MLDLPVRWPSELLGHFFWGRWVGLISGSRWGNRSPPLDSARPERTVADTRKQTDSVDKNGTGPDLGRDNRHARAVPALVRRKIQRGKSGSGYRAGAIASGIPLSLTLVKRKAIGT